MPPKSNAAEVDFKIRINRVLMDRVNTFRHDNRLESKKDAVVILIERGLASSANLAGLNAGEIQIDSSPENPVEKNAEQ